MYWTQRLKFAPSRANHAAVAIRDRIFTFGGYCEEKQIPSRQKIVVDIFDTNSLMWHQIEYQNTEDAPVNVYGHSAVAYGHLIFVWGGSSDSTRVDNRLFCFDTDILGWIYIAATGDIPLPMDGHSACIIGDYMYIFGGYEHQSIELLNTVYRVNLHSYVWELVNTRGFPPAGRDFHTASVIGNCMYIFGGRSMEDNGEIKHNNDTVYLDTVTMTWNTLICDSDIPAARRSHSAVVYEGEIYIFGGVVQIGNYSFHFNDVYKFNPNSTCWSRIEARGEYPSPRRRHCCVAVEDCMILFGGCSRKNKLSEDLIENDDLHILEFNPSLKRLCQLEIIKWRFVLHQLPKNLREEITAMSMLQYSTTNS